MGHMSHSESHLVRYGNPKRLTDEIVTDGRTDGRTDPRTDIASTRPVGFASGKNITALLTSAIIYTALAGLIFLKTLHLLLSSVRDAGEQLTHKFE